MAWTVEVQLFVCNTGEKRIITNTDTEDVETVYKLAQIPARFEYEGVRYWGEKPAVDPIAHKVIYYCEGYKDS